MCGKETMKAAGSVTKKAGESGLAEYGYVEDTEYDQEQAAEAAKDLPNARALANLLDAYVDETAPARQGKVIEDHFWIENETFRILRQVQPPFCSSFCTRICSSFCTSFYQS